MSGPHRNQSSLRDYLAHIYATRCWPSHLRAAANEAIRNALEVVRDERSDLRLKEEAVDHYRLDQHPLVVTVRELEERGWRAVRPKANDRHPYHSVQMQGVGETIIVKIDGSILPDTLDRFGKSRRALPPPRIRVRTTIVAAT